jgi:hypothetical protein
MKSKLLKKSDWIRVFLFGPKSPDYDYGSSSLKIKNFRLSITLELRGRKS